MKPEKQKELEKLLSLNLKLLRNRLVPPNPYHREQVLLKRLEEKLLSLNLKRKPKVNLRLRRLQQKNLRLQKNLKRKHQLLKQKLLLKKLHFLMKM